MAVGGIRCWRGCSWRWNGDVRGGAKGSRETEGGRVLDPTSEAVGGPKEHTVVGALPLSLPDVWLYSEYFWLVEQRRSYIVPYYKHRTVLMGEVF